MLLSSRMFKLTVAIIAFGAISIAGVATNWTMVFASFGVNQESASAPSASPATSANFAIGTCDTAGPIEVESSGGTTSPTAYTTLKAAFDAIIAGTHTGSINIEVCGNTTETVTAVLTASGVGSASYSSVTVRPVGAGRIIEGSIVGAIIKLDGADNVMIDGRQGGAGSARDLTVRNNNTSAATAAIWLASVAAGNGASNNTIRNLEIAAGATQNTGTNSTFGIIMCGTSISTTANGVDNDYNSFIANRIIRARYGIVTRGTTTDLNVNPVVIDNMIGPSNFGADEIGKVGIFMQADTGATVSRNNVQFVGGDFGNSTGGADRVGIGIGQESWSASPSTLTSNTYTVTKNIIHDVIEERTFSSVGLLLGTTGGGSATNNLVANNFIYNVKANGTSGDQAVGLGISGGHSDKVVFNSISMTGDVDPNATASAATNYGSGIRIANVSGSTHANLTLMNNSVYMDLSSSSTAAVRFYAISGPSNAYSFGTGGENYNNYFISASNPQSQTGGLGTTSGNTLTTQFATLANWQSAYTSSQDANAIQSDPQYVSNTADLHIAMASPNVNAGFGIAGLSDDIDGQLRVGVPDIGADEPAGVTPPMNDLAATAVVNPASGSIVGTGASFTPQASFANPGTNSQSNVTVRFRILDSMMGEVYNQTATISSINQGATATVDFPAASISSAGNYTTAASSELAGDENTDNDSVSGSFSAIPPLSGSYNVGSGGDFSSLTNPGGIFESLNAAGASGNLTINIVSDLSGETGAVALNEIAGGFSAIIKPTGAARTITGSSTNSIIRINGADNVIIDGALSGGPATGVGGNASLRNLTVHNTNTAATSGAVIAVMQGANSADNVTIKNVNVSGQDPTQTLIGIHVGGNTVGTAPTTASNNNVTIDNCSFKRSFIAIFDDGVSAAVPATGNVITHNDITATGADRMRRAGILVFNQNGILIESNAIGGIVADESADAIAIIAGIQNVTTTATTSGGVFNAIIAKNRISGITSANSTGFSAVGIAIAGDPAGDNFIGNNMISGVSAPSTSPDIVAGIFVAGVPAASTHLFYNSVSISGDRGSVANQIGSYALAVTGANPTLELKDNVFFNTQTSGGGANALSYSIGMNSSAFTNLASNYNDLFTSGANAGGFRTGSLSATGTDIANLAGWQAATAGDTNSVSADPLFIDAATDPHISPASSLVNLGTVIPAINDDIDSQMRGSQPDIGADETFPGTIQFSSATYSVSEAGPTATLTVKRLGGTDGAVSVSYATGGGTATGGASCGGSVDFVSTSGTINFAIGDGADKTISVPICNDAVFEGDEGFNVTLSNAMGGAPLGTPSVAGVTITDNETAPSIQFSSESYSTIEALHGLSPDGVPGATITITLSVASQTAASVHYATINGTATGGMSCGAGIDYVSVSGTAMVAAGQTSTSFFVPTCQDSVFEGDETVNLLLSSPSGATLGMPNFAVLTITENDPPSPVVVTATAGTTGPTGYTTLKDAVDAINAGTHQGDVTVGIYSSTVETNAPIVLNGNGAGSASYSSLVIQPRSDGVIVSGATPTGRGLIELNGADNVSIDGDNPGSPGTNRNLTLQNTAASTTTFTSVIRLAMATTVITSTDNVVVKDLNIVGSATGRNISSATSTSASENTAFGIFAGPGASTVSSTTAPSAVTSISTSVGSGASASDLKLINNSITAVGRAISINGSSTSVFPNLQIANNAIGNPTAGAADQVYSIGITAQGSPNGLISENTVWVEGYIASSSATHGIDVGVNSATGTFTIDSNQINRVQNNNGQTWSAYGIDLGGGNNHTVQNNFVSGVINSQTAGTGAFGTTFGAYGIRIASGTGHKIYHNSVNLYGPMPGTASTNLTAALLFTATTETGVDARNNAFSNQITGGNATGTRNVVVFLPSGATSAMNLTLNNNGYFAGSDALSRLAQAGTTFGTGEYLASDFDPTQTTPATNFRAYTSTLSAAGTNDNASFASAPAPPFTSNSDLHIPAMTATRLESGGAAVGVTNDIDGEVRDAMTPDIGADEFAGQPPATNDIAASSFVVPVNGSTIPTGSMFGPQANFTNNGTATQMNVTVRFKIFDSSMSAVYDQTAMISMIAPLQSATVTFPSTSIAASGAYTMQASAELAGDSVPANDAINGGFNAISPISGTITVGSGGAYSSLTNPGGLFEALNLAGISGDLTVNITSDLAGETGTVALNQLTESGAGGYTVTIKPSGAARVVSGTSAASSGLITLNGADRIVIDGSLSGGTDRSLTITNNQASTGVVIWMRSPSPSNGATNNTVKNCIINGAPGPNSTTVAGILTGSGTTLGNDAEAANSNNTVQNNWIYRVQNSLYLRGGTTAANFDQNWTVTGNELGSTNANDKNIFRGMLIGNAKNFTISGNTVNGIQSTTTTTAAMSGIQLGLLLDTGIVTGNIISGIKNVSANGSGAAGISVIATSIGSNVTIANNFVTDIAANGSATITSNGHGIAFLSAATTSGYNLYFNSVNMATNQATAQTSAALFVNSTISTAGAINLRNNILANSESTGTRYAVYSAAAATVFAAIDYNDYFAQNVGFIGGSARPMLSDWQTATGGDANSKAVDPLFVSSTDLHLQPGSPMRSMAVSGTGITTDIDGDMRDVNPDVGADELPFLAMPGTLQFSSATYSVGEGGGMATITVTRAGGSDGAVGVSFTTSDGTATGGGSCAGSVDYVTTSGTLMWADGDLANKTFTIPICNDLIPEANETVNIALSNATGGATIGSPGTSTLTITNDDVPGTLSVNDVRVWEGNSGTVNATFTVSYIGNAIPVSVQYSTANGTATAGADYVQKTGTVTFNSPVTEIGGLPTQTQTVTVQVAGDTNKEENETFFLSLSNPTNAVIADGQGVGIINDEDRAFVSDFDHDRATDLSVFRPSEGQWYVWQTTNGTPKIVPFGLVGDRPVPGDYDGDGYVDYALWRSSTGTWYIQSSLDSSVTIVDWGLPGDLPVQGDYDGDGKTDIAIYRPSTGYWWFILSSDGSRPAAQFGISTDLPVQADYDGDLRTDIAVYRDGIWYIARSRDGQIQIANFGLAGDRPVTGDFDGDGSYDLAIYRDGDWWIYNSLTGTVTSLHWGLSGDIPVPADYDRDGITDITVFRPSNGDWYILKSTTNSLIEVHWGAMGDIPTPAGYLPQ